MLLTLNIPVCNDKLGLTFWNCCDDYNHRTVIILKGTLSIDVWDPWDQINMTRSCLQFPFQNSNMVQIKTFKHGSRSNKRQQRSNWALSLRHLCMDFPQSYVAIALYITLFMPSFPFLSSSTFCSVSTWNWNILDWELHHLTERICRLDRDCYLLISSHYL